MILLCSLKWSNNVGKIHLVLASNTHTNFFINRMLYFSNIMFHNLKNQHSVTNMPIARSVAEWQPH